MKRFKLLLFVLVFTLLLAACGEDNEDKNGENPLNGENPTPVETFTVSFYDEDGNLLQSYDLEEGEQPNHTYSVSSTQEWMHTFEGWTASSESSDVYSELPTVTEDSSYFAEVSKVKQQYTVTFVTNGGSIVSSITADYGKSIQVPTNPEKSGFSFVGWTYDAEHKNLVEWPEVITDHQTLYAAWNEAVPLGQYLLSLLDGYLMNPYSHIPEMMRPGSNIVSENDIIDGYSSFVNTDNIQYGHGEQWQMVLDNMDQTMVFFNVLSVIEGISSTSVTVFNNYLDSNPDNVNYYEFNQGIYQITIEFVDSTISYTVDYTTTLPGFGEQNIQLHLEYNVLTSERVGRIQIGDANALKYEVSNNSFTFAIRYMGARRAYFNIETKPDGVVEGQIFEYTGIDGTYHTNSSAYFMIDNTYVSVVGNKASGMLGFSGTIVELYNKHNGELLGLEVRESLMDVVYNTLWFNLNHQTGINTIKAIDESNGNNPNTIYANDSSSSFETKNFGGINLKTGSRRFDIELRSQYVYIIEDEARVRTEITVPMLFIQQERLETLNDDVNEVNTNLSDFALTVSSQVIDRVIEDYESLTVVFDDMKDDISVEYILDYIGPKVEHD